MKTGRTLQDLAAELQRQHDTRKDYIAPCGAIEARVADGGEVVLDGLNGEGIGIQPFAHKQFADHLGIPVKYYDRMRVEQPVLLAQSLNAWLHAKPAEKRMVRTLDGRARAFLSPKFRPLDNYELAAAVLPTLIEQGVQVLSSELTETRLYIKGILPSLSDRLPEGMTWGNGHNAIAAYRGNEPGKVVAAVTISNSDVGDGAFRLEPGAFTTWCTNLAAMVEASMKKYHVGRILDADGNREVYRDETRQADDKAFWLKVADVTRAAFDPEVFRAAIERIRYTATQPIVSAELPKVVEVAVARLALPESTSGSILTYLARGGDLSQWGLSSAITATANDATDYEAATTLERAGGRVLALTGAEWKGIAEASA